MERYIYDERNGLHYELVGDSYLPCLTAPETPELGVWGNRRLSHLRNHRQSIYTGMLLSGKLDSHLEEIDRTATERHSLLMKQMAHNVNSVP